MTAESAPPTDEQWTLNRVVHNTRVFLESLSPENKDSVAAAAISGAEAADDSFGSAIHAGYQAVKGVANDTPPLIVLGVTGVAVAVPSMRFGPGVFLRNTGLALALATALIYPDKIASRVSK